MWAAHRASASSSDKFPLKKSSGGLIKVQTTIPPPLYPLALHHQRYQLAAAIEADEAE